MGGGKGGGTDYNMVAGQQGYEQYGSGAPRVQAGEEYYDPYMQGWDMAAGEAADAKRMNDIFASMMRGNAESASAFASAQSSQAAAAAQAAEEARLGGLRSKRDSMIGGYFDAANQATSFVTDKIAGEKANAALMSVDYNMSDDIKGERISNYFSTLWSEGNQAELEGSFSEVGAGDFEQTLWRGEGTESGPAGSVGEQKAGGGITAKPTKTLIDDEDNQLGASSILGA